MEMEDEERNKIRESISNLSFEQLFKLKEQIGSKTFNKTVFNETTTKKNKNLKRANKNRPRELSSKIRPHKLKQELKSESNNTVVLNKPIPRDPRFDPLCGQFEKETFKANYGFVNDIRLDETRQLEEELESCVDPNRKKIIKSLLQRMKNQIRENERTDKEELKKKQTSTEIRAQLRRGEKPTYKKRSVQKLENLIEKYEELKKSNKVHKHIEKRSKKLAGKEKKKRD